MITRVLKEGKDGNSQASYFDGFTLERQPWYPVIMSMLLQEPILFPQSENLLRNHMEEPHPIINSDLKLRDFLISGIDS